MVVYARLIDCMPHAFIDACVLRNALGVFQDSEVVMSMLGDRHRHLNNFFAPGANYTS